MLKTSSCKRLSGFSSVIEKNYPNLSGRNQDVKVGVCGWSDISLTVIAGHFMATNEGFGAHPQCVGGDPMVICFPQSILHQLNLAKIKAARVSRKLHSLHTTPFLHGLHWGTWNSKACLKSIPLLSSAAFRHCYSLYLIGSSQGNKIPDSEQSRVNKENQL